MARRSGPSADTAQSGRCHAPYLCRDPATSRAVRWFDVVKDLVARWCVGAVGDVDRVRAGAQPYLGPRPVPAPGRRHDGWWGDPAGGSVAAARSIRAVHANVAAGAGVEPAAAHLGDEE